jgi:hypothetical protein
MPEACDPVQAIVEAWNKRRRTSVRRRSARRSPRAIAGCRSTARAATGRRRRTHARPSPPARGAAARAARAGAATAGPHPGCAAAGSDSVCWTRPATGYREAAAADLRMIVTKDSARRGARDLVFGGIARLSRAALALRSIEERGWPRRSRKAISRSDQDLARPFAQAQ